MVTPNGNGEKYIANVQSIKKADIQPKPLFIIKRISTKKMELSKRTVIEQKIINERMKKCQDKFSQIIKILEKTFEKEMTLFTMKSIAICICHNYGIKLDRLSQRNKNAMKCWFVENWNNIFPLLGQVRSNITNVDQAKD